MTMHTCTRCLKTFDRGYNLDRHLTRKRRCKLSDKVERIDSMEKDTLHVSLKITTEDKGFKLTCEGLTFEQLQDVVRRIGA